jgi:hypothetical protein
MPTVRTTMRPDQEIEVSDAEALDLSRQGLLVQETAPPTPAPGPAPAMKAAPSAATKKEG